MKAVSQRRGPGPWEPAGRTGPAGGAVALGRGRHLQGEARVVTRPYREQLLFPPRIQEERLGCRAGAVSHCEPVGMFSGFQEVVVQPRRQDQ